MSSPIRDVVEEHRNYAMWIQNFLYEGKPHKKQFKQHTIEEFQQFLDGLHDSLWGTFHDAEHDVLGYD